MKVSDIIFFEAHWKENLYFFFTFLDPRTKSWFLGNSPGPLISILVTYLYFCLYAGPRYMKNRKPFQLKNTLIVYNIAQVILSIILVIEVSEWVHVSTVMETVSEWKKAIDNMLCICKISLTKW